MAAVSVASAREWGIGCSPKSQHNVQAQKLVWKQYKGLLLLFGLGHFLFRWILQDVGVQAVAHVHVRHGATGLALQVYALLFDLDNGLRVAAVVALHILLDEVLQASQASVKV